MGFPIKRITCANHDDCGPAPCGLDLLSAAIDIDARLVSVARPEPAPSSSLCRPRAQGTIAPSLTRQVSGGDGDESRAAPEASSSQTAASSGNKQSRPFPAVLRDILSEPEHESVVSWLPHGRSFAVHDTSAFSSEILPKYFRRVAFRSFARKLNRWGFRSVMKSISGFDATFEHNLFRRDEPELSQGMTCRSNPATTKSRAAVAASQARAGSQARAIPTHPVPLQALSQDVPLRTASAQTHTKRQVISPSFSAVGTAGVAPRAPGTAAPIAAASAPHGNRDEEFPAVPVRPRSQELAIQELRNSLEEELAVRLQDELILQRHRFEREREILRFLREMPASQSDAVSRYIADKLRRQMLERQRGHGGY